MGVEKKSREEDSLRLQYGHIGPTLGPEPLSQEPRISNCKKPS